MDKEVEGEDRGGGGEGEEEEGAIDPFVGRRQIPVCDSAIQTPLAEEYSHDTEMGCEGLRGRDT